MTTILLSVALASFIILGGEVLILWLVIRHMDRQHEMKRRLEGAA